MKLTHLLMTLGLVHGSTPLEAPPTEEASSGPTQVLSLEGLRAREAQGQAQREAEELGLEKSWQEIYREKGIGDPPGGIFLEDLDRRTQGLPAEEARLVVLSLLHEKGAPIREVLLDGQSRDEALDAYERLLDQRVAARRLALKDRAAALLREAEALQVRSAELGAALEAWKGRKHEEEDLMELLGGMLAGFSLEAQPPQAPERGAVGHAPAEG